MESLYPHLLEIVSSIGLIAILIKSYLNGNSKVSGDVIAAYKLRVEQLIGEVKEEKDRAHVAFEGFRKQIQDLSLKIGEQNGIISEKNKQLEKYELIFQNRDPKLVTVLENIEKFMKELHVTLKNVDDRTKRSEDRDIAVDQGHIVATKK